MGMRTWFLTLLATAGCGHSAAVPRAQPAETVKLMAECHQVQQRLLSRYRGPFDAKRGTWGDIPLDVEVQDMHEALSCAALERVAGISQKVLLRRSSRIDSRTGAILGADSVPESGDAQRRLKGLFWRAHAIFGTSKFEETAQDIGRFLSGSNRESLAQADQQLAQ